MYVHHQPEDLPEAIRGHFQNCLKSTFDEIMAARDGGRHLSLPNSLRFFQRQWRVGINRMPTPTPHHVIRAGHEKAERLLRVWFHVPR